MRRPPCGRRGERNLRIRIPRVSLGTVRKTGGLYADGRYSNPQSLAGRNSSQPTGMRRRPRVRRHPWTLRLRKERPMSPINIIRGWKDAEYRQSLSAADLALLPAHPAGLIQLTDDDLDSIAGGRPKLTEGVCHTVVACPTGTGCMTFVSDGCPGGVS